MTSVPMEVGPDQQKQDLLQAPLMEEGTTTTTKEEAGCSPKIIILLVLVAIIGVILVDSFTSQISTRILEDFLTWMQAAGFWGMCAFVGFYIVGTLLFLPGLILTLGAGFIFAQAYSQALGVLIGSICVFIGATVGASLAFLLGRYVLKDYVLSKASKYPILLAIDKAFQAQGLKIICLLRLSPLIPFNALNYLMGSTSIPFKQYVIGCVGMVPGTIAYVYFGTLLSDLKDVADGADTSSDPALEYTLLIVGVIAAIAAVSVVGFYAKRALTEAIEEVKEEEAPIVLPGTDTTHQVDVKTLT